jgi:hypothetical protein
MIEFPRRQAFGDTSFFFASLCSRDVNFFSFLFPYPDNLCKNSFRQILHPIAGANSFN